MQPTRTPQSTDRMVSTRSMLSHNHPIMAWTPDLSGWVNRTVVGTVIECCPEETLPAGWPPPPPRNIGVLASIWLSSIARLRWWWTTIMTTTTTTITTTTATMTMTKKGERTLGHRNWQCFVCWCECVYVSKCVVCVMWVCVCDCASANSKSAKLHYRYRSFTLLMNIHFHCGPVLCRLVCYRWSVTLIVHNQFYNSFYLSSQPAATKNKKKTKMLD